MITVTNGKTTGFIGEDKIYIGRTNKHYNLAKSPLCNPYSVRQYGRAGSIRMFATYLLFEYQSGEGPVFNEINRLLQLMTEGHDIELTCWCKPLDCHGDIIKRLLEKFYESKRDTGDH